MSSIEGPVGLVAVAGLYRTGKSYLLNRMLLNRSDGFGVGPTINPCTKVSFPPQPNFLNLGSLDMGKTHLGIHTRRRAHKCPHCWYRGARGTRWRLKPRCKDLLSRYPSLIVRPLTPNLPLRIDTSYTTALAALTKVPFQIYLWSST
jgi:hypothetical protein